MSYREELREYTEPLYGVISNQRNPGVFSCHNNTLFTLTAFLNLSSISEADKDLFYIWLMEIEIEPGRYHRFPGRTESTMPHDDLVAIAVMAQRLGMARVAKEIYEYGKRNFWVWAPLGKEKDPIAMARHFWGRMPGFIPALKACAGEDLNWFDRLSFWAACQSVRWEKPDNTNGKCLMRWKILAVQHRDEFIDQCIGEWKWRMRKQYSKGWKSVYEWYFKKDHPITRYAPEEFYP